MFWLNAAACLLVFTDNANERKAIIKNVFKGALWGCLIFFVITMWAMAEYPTEKIPYKQMIVCTGIDGKQHVKFSPTRVSEEWHPEIPCGNYRDLVDQ